MTVSPLFLDGPYRLDPGARQLTRGRERVDLSPSQCDVLHLLVRHPDVVLSKDALITAGWGDFAVGDNSLEKLIGQLRRYLDAGDRNRYIKTVPRRGYQFVAAVTPVLGPEGDPELELVLAPQRAWIEGRAALESLQCDRIGSARATFQRLLEQHPGEATYHIGMANACVMQFEAARTDPAPDADALQLAASHAQQACRLSPDLAEGVGAAMDISTTGSSRKLREQVSRLIRATSLEPKSLWSQDAKDTARLRRPRNQTFL